MGIRGKLVGVMLTIAVAIGALGFYQIHKSHQHIIELEALRIATIVSTQVFAERATYTSKVVGKLEQDGTGAARHSETMAGHVMLPAQFARAISELVDETANNLYSYSLKSKWNINTARGLADDFDRWAWKRLEAQDKAFSRNPAPETSSGYPWKPVYRFDVVDGKQVLRYIKADPASAEACVTCHNNLEQKPEIIAMRRENEVQPGRRWKLHQLMGAIRVNVPIDKVAATAETARKELVLWMAAVFAVGFLGLFAMTFKFIIAPVEKSVSQVDTFTDKVEAVVECNRHLLLGAEDQVKACKEARSARAEDTTVIFEQLESIANTNAMKAEEAAVYCNNLEESFAALRSLLKKILTGR